MGSALSLEYVAGNLHRAATRGSGERGEDVTLNAKLVANVPLRLNIPADCHVRGEVVMPLSVFEQNIEMFHQILVTFVLALYAKSMVMERLMQLI